MLGIPRYNATEWNIVQMLIIPLGEMVVLVEGKNDSKVYSKLFDRKVKILNSAEVARDKGVQEGKDYIKSLINEQKEINVIGIVDSDFDKLLDKVDNEERLFYTDAHDLEIMVLANMEENDISDDYIESIINIEADRKKIKTIVNDVKSIKEIALYLGCLKYNSRTTNDSKQQFKFSKNDLQLTTTEEMTYKNYKRVLCSNNDQYYKYFYYETNNELSKICFDKDAYIRVLNSEIKVNTLKSIGKEIAQLTTKIKDRRQIYNGHDVANIISVFIDARLKKKVDVENVIVEKWDKSSFLTTDLIYDLFKYENKNKEKLGEFINKDLRRLIEKINRI